MRSDHIANHMKIHDKHVDVEPPPTIPSTYIPPVFERSGYNPTNMEDETLLKKMLKCDREFKENNKIYVNGNCLSNIPESYEG